MKSHNNVWLMITPHLTLKPSQWINTGWIMFGLLGLPLVIPPLITIYKIVEVNNHEYNFFHDHIQEIKGVFTKTTNEVQYFRIKSIQLKEPLLYRIMGLSTLMISSSDWYAPFMDVTAIPIGQELMHDIQKIVKTERKRNKVREYDV